MLLNLFEQGGDSRIWVDNARIAVQIAKAQMEMQKKSLQSITEEKSPDEVEAESM